MTASAIISGTIATLAEVGSSIGAGAATVGSAVAEGATAAGGAIADAAVTTGSAIADAAAATADTVGGIFTAGTEAGAAEGGTDAFVEGAIDATAENVADAAVNTGAAAEGLPEALAATGGTDAVVEGAIDATAENVADEAVNTGAAAEGGGIPWKEGLALGGLVGSAASGIYGGVSSHQAGKAQQKAYDAAAEAEMQEAANEASSLYRQAGIEDVKAAVSQISGEKEAEKRSRVLAADIGQMYADYAGNGLMVDGASKDTLGAALRTEVAEAQSDIDTIRDNAAMNVWTSQANAANYRTSALNRLYSGSNKASTYRTMGSTARSSGRTALGTSLLSAGGSLLSGGAKFL